MKLNNTKLQLDCLLNMSKIAKMFGTEQEQEKNEDEPKTITIFERAYDVNKTFGIFNLIFSVQKDWEITRQRTCVCATWV